MAYKPRFADVTGLVATYGVRREADGFRRDMTSGVFAASPAVRTAALVAGSLDEATIYAPAVALNTSAWTDGEYGFLMHDAVGMRQWLVEEVVGGLVLGFGNVVSGTAAAPTTTQIVSALMSYGIDSGTYLQAIKAAARMAAASIPVPSGGVVTVQKFLAAGAGIVVTVNGESRVVTSFVD